MLAEYKGDNTYIVSCEKKNIDEDDFRNKFPYTLDEKPVEKEIRPPQPPPTATKPAAKVKSAKDIADEAFTKKHNEQ